MSGGRHASSHKAAGDQTHHHLHGCSAAVLDCTSECRLERHAETALCSAYLGNVKLLQHCQSICGNPFAITDGFGRNVLHVAASRGHLHLVHWLLTRRKVAVNVADWESRWSALHRSLFYGHLGVGVYLVKVCACVYNALSMCHIIYVIMLLLFTMSEKCRVMSGTE